jgi:GNAT superfamily N-acetyltransferase
MRFVATPSHLAEVRAALESDREWSAFALADLAPEYAKHSEWYLASGPALALVYHGRKPPILFALGSAENVEPLLGKVLRGREFHFAVRPDVFDLIPAAGYEIRDAKAMWRMVLHRDRFPTTRTDRAERLCLCHCEELLRLYRDGEAAGEAPVFFNESMLRKGVYFGIREEGALVAAAGTHVLAFEQSVGGIGNVYTRRDRRHRGLGSLVTAAVAADLVEKSIKTIALNVAAENHAAIRVYERLGFRRYCEYREARAIVAKR